MVQFNYVFFGRVGMIVSLILNKSIKVYFEEKKDK